MPCRPPEVRGGPKTSPIALVGGPNGLCRDGIEVTDTEVSQSVPYLKTSFGQILVSLTVHALVLPIGQVGRVLQMPITEVVRVDNQQVVGNARSRREHRMLRDDQRAG